MTRVRDGAKALRLSQRDFIEHCIDFAADRIRRKGVVIKPRGAA